ncbi:hypothetical protein ACS0TY_017787 [Phlomoides rotata]
MVRIYAHFNIYLTFPADSTLKEEDVSCYFSARCSNPVSAETNFPYTMAAVAARSLMRSTTGSARSATARLSAGVKPRASPSPFRTASQNPLSARIFRSPVELSSVSVLSMLPYHTATASALLSSMLSVAPRGYGWSIDENDRLGGHLERKYDYSIWETGDAIIFIIMMFLVVTSENTS